MIDVFIACQLFVVLFIGLHDWIPLGTFNDVRGVHAADTRSKLLVVTVLSTLPFAIGLAATAFYAASRFPTWLVWLLWISYGTGLYGLLRTWYVPYLFVPDPVRAARYQLMFGNTHAFLPVRNGIVPNTLHVIFHAILLATVVLLVYLTWGAYFLVIDRSIAIALVILFLAFSPVSTATAVFADSRQANVLAGLEGLYYIADQPRMPHTLADRMRFYRVPAVSIAVIDNYKIAWTYAAGLRDTAHGAPATTTTPFQAASMSKAVAAAGILRLFQEKHLSLDADVNTLLRSWHLPEPATASSGVTMRRLLSHSAGINVHGFTGYDRNTQLPTVLEVLDGAPPANSVAIRVTGIPGAKTEYSGGGTTIAQQVATDVSGEPFPVFMRQTLLTPLGMSDSTFEQPLPKALWPRAADGYYSDDKPVHGGWHVYPTMAAAGLWTTPADLATFVIAIQNALRGRGRPPIDATVAREMTTKASKTFGLGPALAPGYFMHNGANEGFQGTFIGLAAGGRGVVVMTNSDNGVALADQIVHAVAESYRWPVLRPEPKRAVELSEAQMNALTGSYSA
ncbi:MAG TPA: serine hydrolase domain-containing protein, partial [Candidatus Acidoferrum sp.]|nr:serine hydrolase domain-containing protein [Candidatus Acidoferrum sp.]